MSKLETTETLKKAQPCFICGTPSLENICDKCLLDEQTRLKNQRELEDTKSKREEKSADLYDQRKEWLEAHATHIWNVFEDDNGEYIWEEPTIMDEGENENVKPHKVYLPAELNKDNIFKKRHA